jgi:FMN phosphatase YigB (HAD superfamily)
MLYLKKNHMKDFAIIYDLDQTILPASALPEETFFPIYDAVRAVNHGTVPDEELEKALKRIRTTSMDIIVKEHHFSKEMEEAAKQAFLNSEYEFTLMPFDDYEVLKRIPGMRFLVTSGIPKMQQAKCDALSLEGDFDGIVVDNIYDENRPGKKKIFEQIAQEHSLIPDLVWIVGDNPDSEITSGNELGMKTVQILRPGIEKSDKASYVVSSFYELNDLITKWQSSLSLSA